MKFVDLTGKSFGRLTVIARAENKGDQTRWRCRCECGTEIVAYSGNLKNGHTKSCGCLNNEKIGNLNKTHGSSRTRLYRIWNAMKHRKYGDRRIPVCDEWQAFEPFYNWSMANGYADGLTIDRENGSEIYEPSNCRWVTQETQQNNRSNNHLIEYNGETHTVAEWARLTGINRGTILSRIKRGWPVDKALQP